MPDNNKVFHDIKAKSNLYDFVKEKAGNSTAKRVGSAWRFNGCPLCDANDSFTISDKEPELYKCYACDDGGDIFNFYAKFAGLTAGEALKELAERYQVDLEDRVSKPVNSLQKVLRAAAKYYQSILQSDKKAMQWLTSDKPAGRGHSKSTVERLEIGLTDGKLSETLQKQGFTIRQIKQSGLYVEDKNTKGKFRDFFIAGLVIFPHRLPNSDIGHFTIKDPNKKISYQLSSEHRLNDLFFANQRAIQNDEVIIVEGENDLASCADIDIYNAMACIGQLSDVQIQWLVKKSSGKTFYFWFDNDTKWKNGKPPAGINYTRKLYQALLKNHDCNVLVLSALMDSGEDPDDFIQKDKSNAKERVANLKRFAMTPLVWEVAAMPVDVKVNLEAAERYLQDIKFFEYMGLVPTIKRAAIVKELEKIGFSHDDIHSEIKEIQELRKQLDDYRYSTDTQTQKTEHFQRKFALRVWNHFSEHGKFFVSSDEKLNLFYKHDIYSIGDNSPWQGLILQETGLNSTTPIYKFTTAEVKALCQIRGERLESFSWLHNAGSQLKPKIFYNLNDEYNRIIKVSENDISLVDNGTNDDKVLLSKSHNIKSFEFVDTANIQTGMNYLNEYVLSSQTCPPDQAYYVVAHALSSFLLPLTESQALLKLEGGSQSAKTSSARVCGYLLYGKDMVGRLTTASAYSMAGQEPWLIFDNIENNNINQNLLDFMLLVSTGASNFKRSSGSDSGVTVESLNTLAVITGIEPFDKAELINRTFIIKHNRDIWGDIKYHEAIVKEKIISHRNEILSAWLMLLSTEIFPSLADSSTILNHIRTRHKGHSKDRMDEHLTLLTLICRSLFKYIPLTGELKKKAGNEPPEYFLLDRWIKYQNEIASETESGTNSIIPMLDGIRHLFVQEFKNRPIDAENRGPQTENGFVFTPIMNVDVHREAVIGDGYDVQFYRYHFDISSRELLAIFQRYAKLQGIKMTFKSSGQLTARLKNDVKVLAEAGWKVEYEFKKVRGTRFNRYVWEG